MTTPIDILEETIILAAAQPGLTKEEQFRANLSKDVLLPLVRIIQTGDMDKSAVAMAVVAQAASLFMISDPDKALEYINKDARRYAVAFRLMFGVT